MALEYFLYRTDLNNTLVDRSNISFAPLPPNTGEIYIDFMIPEIQPLYLYRENGGDIIFNDEETIRQYIDEISPPPSPEDSVTYDVFTEFSGETDTKIEYARRLGTYGIATGLITGGTMTTSSGDNTKFDIEPLYGLVIDQYTNPTNPEITEVHFTGATGITPNFLTTQQVTYIAVDKELNIIQTPNPITSDERREYISLGMVLHKNLEIIDDFNNSPTIVPDIAGITYDFMTAVGLIRYDSGNRILPNSNNLELKKTEGFVFRHSVNYVNDKKTPNVVFFPEESPLQFYYRTFDNQFSDDLTQIITNEYEEIDELGNSTIVPITGSGQQATVQRVILFPSGKVVIQRGQVVYDTIQQAVNTFLDEDFKYEKNISEDGLQIGAIALTVHCDDLSNNCRAAFIPTDRYGSLLGGGNTGFYELDKNLTVRVLCDLPNPDVNKVIKLSDGFIYNISGVVDIGDNHLELGKNCVIRGRNPSNDMIMGNTSGATFIGEDKDVLFNYVGLRNTNPNGQLFDVDAQGDESRFVMQDCYLIASNLGVIKGYTLIYIDSNAEISGRDGFYFYGKDTDHGLSNTDVYINNYIFYNHIGTGNTCVSIIDGYFKTIKIWDSNYTIGSGNTFLHVENNNVNIFDRTLKLGVISNNDLYLEEGGELFSGIDQKTPSWVFKTNRGVEDSQVFGFIEFVGNTTETIVNSTAVYYKAEGINTGRTQGERMDVSTNNRILYSCPCFPIVNGTIMLSGNMETQGNNQVLSVSVFKNGTELIVEQEVFAPRSGEAVGFSTNTVDSFESDYPNGDYYEIFVRNFTSTNNIILDNMQFSVTGKI